MKLLFFVIIAALSLGLSPYEKEIVRGARVKIQTLEQQLDDTQGRLVWVHKELTDLQPKIDQIGRERDEYKGRAEVAEKRVLEQESTILKLWVAISGLSLALLAMIVWKFKLYRFIPGLTFAP